ILSLKPDGSYATMSGTSFAAPQVSGIAALEIASGRSLAGYSGIVHFGGAPPAPTTPVPTPTLQPQEQYGSRFNPPIPTRSSQVSTRLTTALAEVAAAWTQ